MTARFRLIRAFKDGHRFYTDAETGRIAVADQGALDNRHRIDLGPEATDDGVLWLDFSREVIRHSMGFSIPLEAPDGRRSSTPADLQEVNYVVDTFRMGKASPAGYRPRREGEDS